MLLLSHSDCYRMRNLRNDKPRFMVITHFKKKKKRFLHMINTLGGYLELNLDKSKEHNLFLAKVQRNRFAPVFIHKATVACLQLQIPWKGE